MKLDSELKIKLAKFKSDKRAWFSFLFLFSLFAITLPAEILCNVRPLVMSVGGKLYFPAFVQYSEKEFGGSAEAEPDYHSQSFQNFIQGVPATNQNSPAVDLSDFDDEEPALAEDDSFGLGLGDFEDTETASPEPEAIFTLTLEDFEEEDAFTAKPEISVPQPTAVQHQPKDVWFLWPPVRYDYKYISTQSRSGREVLASPFETRSKIDNQVILSSRVDGHYLGTDDRGRDVLARLIYGFRISMIFGISLAITGTLVGCLLGGVQGYFGGWIDLIGQRITEIWGSMPRLFILIIISSLLTRSVLVLFLVLNLTAWMGIAAYIRAEFLKVRNLEFVKAAKAMGVSDFKIMRRHILPNSLTPVITFFPFEVTAGILALVSLDFLNLGVPSPAPSIGELLSQGKANLQATWIILPTFAVLTITLSLLTFVGDGIRNAFDPRKAN